MRARLLPVICVLLAVVALMFVSVDGGAGALLVVTVLSLLALYLFRRFIPEDKAFITNVFLAGLLLRLAFGILVHIYDLREFFGGDANTYDTLGSVLLKQWTEPGAYIHPLFIWQLNNSGSGWGMNYFVAFIYLLVGKNILAAQSFCGVVGAAIGPMLYVCAQKVFANKSVARRSAMLAAFFPAFIIWSGQLLKDGLMVFLLVLAMAMILSLQQKFSYSALLLLFAAVAGVLPLRFYIFYMLAVALVCSVVIAFSNSAQAVLRNTMIVLVLGLGLTYIGITRNAQSAFETYGSLTKIEASRQDLASTAASGFASDADVSTTSGALSAIPVGFVYLMLAPFPWQVSSFRASVTIPEVFVWWAMLPLMISGILWSLRHQFRRAFPILLFMLLLSLAYSVFLGNVGTAYRQRTQIQVFSFMFIAVGWTLRQEKRENERILNESRRAALVASIRRPASPIQN